MQERTSPRSVENAIALQKYGVGQPVRRKEDDTLVRGKGKYTDDFTLPGQAYCFMVRSSHAHGIIKGIETAAAKAMPGVLGVWTGKDLEAAGYNPFTCGLPLKSRDGSPLLQTNRPALATDKVRFVGDPVAFVVAETLAQARDAAEAVELDIEPLPAVTDAAEATKAGNYWCQGRARHRHRLPWPPQPILTGLRRPQDLRAAAYRHSSKLSFRGRFRTAEENYRSRKL